MAKFFQLNHGGDATNNVGWTLYPQNVGQITDVVSGGTPLRVAAHHGPGTQLIVREILLGDSRNNPQPALRNYLDMLAQTGAWPVGGDILGLLTIPHASIVRGVQFQNCCPVEGVTGDLIRVSDGEVLLPGIDLSQAPGLWMADLPLNSFKTAYGENDVIGLKLTAFPTISPSTGDCIIDCMQACNEIVGMCFSAACDVFKGIDDDCADRCRNFL